MRTHSVPARCAVALSLATLAVAIHGRARATPARPPAYALRTLDAGALRIELDLRGQVLAMDLADNSEVRAAQAPLAACLPIGPVREFMPASVLAQKAKVFDDGLVAAVELAAERGHGRFPAKALLLATVARALARDGGAGQAHEVVLAAESLGGLGVALPEALRPAVERRIDEFLARDDHSKPIGVYTWSPDLSALFRQDRMLQSDLSRATDLDALVRALSADRETPRAYAAMLDLHARLTNRLAWSDLRPLLAGGRRPDTLSFLPASTTHESALVKALFGGAPPPDFPLADLLVRAVRERRISLEPQTTSGWYDRQAWAFEPLIVPERTPEASRLQVRGLYGAMLEGLFESLLALARETHIKQVETPVLLSSVIVKGAPIYVRPGLTVEPLATHYRRRAESYVFVREVLERAMGDLGSLHRLTADGPVAASLNAELDTLTALHHGAYLRVCRELGMQPEPLVDRDADEDLRTFDAWRAAIGRDPDVAIDTRMMVPVYVDTTRHVTHVWAMLGWSQHTLDVDFVTRPEYRVLDARGRPSGAEPDLRFGGDRHAAVYPVFAELDVTHLLDRDQFRALCDREQTRERILAALR